MGQESSMKTPAKVNQIQESITTPVWDSLNKIAAFVASVYFANYFSTTCSRRRTRSSPVVSLTLT
jgi:hypothetical protein